MVNYGTEGARLMWWHICTCQSCSSQGNFKLTCGVLFLFRFWGTWFRLQDSGFTSRRSFEGTIDVGSFAPLEALKLMRIAAKMYRT